jgi:hypothetical protein
MLRAAHVTLPSGNKISGGRHQLLNLAESTAQGAVAVAPTWPASRKLEAKNGISLGAVHRENCEPGYAQKVSRFWGALQDVLALENRLPCKGEWS